jgi:hypothetical protein
MAAIFHFFACLAIGVSVTAAADNQTVITIHNAFPRPYNPKTLATSAKKVCYPNLGCFAIGSVDDRFKHHICLPEKPEIINVKTHLNTRQEPMVGTNADILRWRDPETIRKSSFDSTKVDSKIRWTEGELEISIDEPFVGLPISKLGI